MKTIRKKIRVLIVLSIMMLLLCMWDGITVYADESKVQNEETRQVVITALPEFEIGASVADANIEYVPVEGVEVKTQWQIYDPERVEYTHWFERNEGVFEAGEIYDLYIYAYIEDDYEFYGDNLFCYNNEELETWIADDENGRTVFFHRLGRYADGREIVKVDVTTSEAEAGKVAFIDAVVFYDREGNIVDAPDLAKNITWKVRTGGSIDDCIGETFEAEKVYFLAVEVDTTDAYYFPERITLVINGKEEEVVVDPRNCGQWITYSLKTPLSSLVVSVLPEVKAGNEIADIIQDDFGDINVSAEWYDKEGNRIKEGVTFASGRSYILNLYASTFYQSLTEDFVFIVDGVIYEPTELDTTYNYASTEIEFNVPAIIEDELEETVESEKKESEKTKEKAPETGDRAQTMMWVVVTMIAGRFIIFARRRHM